MKFISPMYGLKRISTHLETGLKVFEVFSKATRILLKKMLNIEYKSIARARSITLMSMPMCKTPDPNAKLYSQSKHARARGYQVQQTEISPVLDRGT